MDNYAGRMASGRKLLELLKSIAAKTTRFGKSIFRGKPGTKVLSCRWRKNVEYEVGV